MLYRFQKHFTFQFVEFIERCSTLAVGGRGKLHKAIPAKKKHGKSDYRVLIDIYIDIYIDQKSTPLFIFDELTLP